MHIVNLHVHINKCVTYNIFNITNNITVQKCIYLSN